MKKTRIKPKFDTMSWLKLSERSGSVREENIF